MIVFEFVYGILKSSFDLLAEMGPYLIFGFLAAGLLKEFISAEQIAKHLGKSSMGSVVKAALFGIPLPLCSCGVIPPTMALRKAGASRGSVLSFLIATPTTGVDSIFATYSLLGPVFAVYRVIASFFAGIFSGLTANLLESPEEGQAMGSTGKEVAPEKLSFVGRAKRVFKYAFIDLLSEIGKWLMIGILIGGLISYLIPADFFQEKFTAPWQSMLIVLAFSVPLYVCATGSIPIAAALMMKGLNPGAAFVLLLAGPATNAVTITVIGQYLGKKTTAIYLVTLILSSLGLGLLLDFIWSRWQLGYTFTEHMHHQMLPHWLELGSAALLVGLLVYINLKFSRFFNKQKEDVSMPHAEKQSDFSVPNMTCNNCVSHVQKALEGVEGVEQVKVDLKSKNVVVYHDNGVAWDQLVTAVQDAGYQVEDK